ncbi:prepilin-type N-terminal cleavage/methylation domain-containing protein [Photobacterium carnosum]|uniref:type II secretion system protein n=1 Tax=Photobacterium carnosum TaxID=2023717 RepID=UPI0022B7D63A|nr:prepilin-type N-terminal cleavage/methylation domain-containing protein [Photobacterium carnosum]MCD9555155.1 prepilin-type N-terminal cleavage/methylation domain-containing protein [Photobacterium carnosum]
MRNKGFTLIELVVVIVILGILAVVAAPKFMGLQRDARIADLKGLEGSLKAANEMVYAKAAMKGLEHSQYFEKNTSENNIEVNGVPVPLHFGHIIPNKEYIKRILDISDDDWNIQGGGITARFPIHITPKTAPTLNCYLSYGFQNWNIPQYKLETSGC